MCSPEVNPEPLDRFDMFRLDAMEAFNCFIEGHRTALDKRIQSLRENTFAGPVLDGIELLTLKSTYLKYPSAFSAGISIINAASHPLFFGIGFFKGFISPASMESDKDNLKLLKAELLEVKDSEQSKKYLPIIEHALEIGSNMQYPSSFTRGHYTGVTMLALNALGMVLTRGNPPSFPYDALPSMLNGIFAGAYSNKLLFDKFKK